MCVHVCVCVSVQRVVLQREHALRFTGRIGNMEQTEGPSRVKRKKNSRWFLAHRYSAKYPGMGTIWTKIFPPHQTKCELENRKNTPPHTKPSQEAKWLKGGNFAQCRRKWSSTGPSEGRAARNAGRMPPEHPRRRKEGRPCRMWATEDCLAKRKGEDKKWRYFHVH